MRYVALACDFDGTLADDGTVAEATLAALERLVSTGRALILVTGRVLDEILDLFPRADLFAYIVAENGALLFHPATRQQRLLGDPPPAALVARLRERGVEPLALGRVIAATWRPREVEALSAIGELGLEHQIIFNRGAVMILPPGINKATGLSAALDRLRISPHNAVAVGDSENDHALFNLAGCAVAVANALPSLKAQADLVTSAANGAGVAELCRWLVEDDPALAWRCAQRRRIVLGRRADQRPVELPATGARLLIAGGSCSGKTTVAMSIIEQLLEQGYQLCVIDPEGDYDPIGRLVRVGPEDVDPESAVLRELELPAESVLVSLVDLPLADRPRFIGSLMRRLNHLHRHTGRPHWLVLDEAHQLYPATTPASPEALPAPGCGVVLVTMFLEHLLPAAMADLDRVMVLGDMPAATLQTYATALERQAPAVPWVRLERGRAVVWSPGADEPPVVATTRLPARRPRRHRRKYAEGDVGPERSFYFRGPRGALNVRAENLLAFTARAAEVDDETWRYHLARGDYSRWIRDVIRDDALADEIAAVEHAAGLATTPSRTRIRKLIAHRYTCSA